MLKIQETKKGIVGPEIADVPVFPRGVVNS
jgi:hypothetical protein